MNTSPGVECLMAQFESEKPVRGRLSRRAYIVDRLTCGGTGSTRRAAQRAACPEWGGTWCDRACPPQMRRLAAFGWSNTIAHPRGRLF
eukprot:5211789-Pleurochrysis_carterae.AAC.1